MREIITYSLRQEGRRSDQFYVELAAFTDLFLEEAGIRIGCHVERFTRFLEQNKLETVRSRSEYLFELSTLGIFLRIYGGDAIRLARGPGRLLSALSDLRRRYRWSKKAVDPVRGWLAALFLFPNGAAKPTPSPDLDAVERLLKWMSAAGDFPEEIKRFLSWQSFLEGEPEHRVKETLGAALGLAGWFEDHGEATLGRYTPHVEKFLDEQHPNYRWREDGIFCGRKRVEYHNNMVGAEIMNRAYRKGFLQAGKKVVLLPPCMKAKPDDGCEAKMTSFGELCNHCTPGCRVHQVTRLGQKHGFDVFILPHELSIFSEGSMKPAGGRSVGIVGVSCPLTITTGGWETRALGVPSQGVMLDYCGCPWHWHDDGIMTDINFKKLLEVVDVEKR